MKRKSNMVAEMRREFVIFLDTDKWYNNQNEWERAIYFDFFRIFLRGTLLYDRDKFTYVYIAYIYIFTYVYINFKGWSLGWPNVSPGQRKLGQP